MVKPAKLLNDRVIKKKLAYVLIYVENVICVLEGIFLLSWGSSDISQGGQKY